MIHVRIFRRYLLDTMYWEKNLNSTGKIVEVSVRKPKFWKEKLVPIGTSESYRQAVEVGIPDFTLGLKTRSLNT